MGERINISSKLQEYPVNEVFNELCENFSISNSIHFMDYFRHLPKETMLENWSCLYKINTNNSLSFMNELISTSKWEDEELTQCKEELNNFMKNNEKANKEKLSESLTIIDNLIEQNNSVEYIKDKAMQCLYESRFRKYCLYESYLNNELEIIMYNINYVPETIDDLELLIRKIKLSSLPQVISSFPKLLDKSTEMITIINRQLTGDVLNLVVSIPTVIAEKLIEGKVNRNQIKTYIKMIDRQFVIMSKVLKSEEKREYYNMYRAYMDSLNIAKEKLSKESSGKAYENITDMNPDIVLYDESVIDDMTGDLEDAIANIIFDPIDDINTESFDNFVRLANTYSCLVEKTNAIIKTANKVGDTNRKIANKVNQVDRNSNRVGTAIRKSLEPLSNLVSKTVEKIKSADKKTRTEAIISGGEQHKFAGFIRKTIIGLGALVVGGGAAAMAPKVIKGAVKGTIALSKIVNPIIAIISILTGIAIDKKIDKKYRQSILNDLEMELKLTNEKLEDARADGDRKAKYELMRIQNKLQKDIERIKYNLK